MKIEIAVVLVAGASRTDVTLLINNAGIATFGGFLSAEPGVYLRDLRPTAAASPAASR